MSRSWRARPEDSTCPNTYVNSRDNVMPCVWPATYGGNYCGKYVDGQWHTTTGRGPRGEQGPPVMAGAP